MASNTNSLGKIPKPNVSKNPLQLSLARQVLMLFDTDFDPKNLPSGGFGVKGRKDRDKNARRGS